MPSSPAEESLSWLVNRLERRRQGVMLARGLGFALLLVVIAAVLGMSLDTAFVLPRSVRWFVWLGGLGTVVAVLALSAWHAFARPVDMLGLTARAGRTITTNNNNNNDEGIENLAAAVALTLAPQPHGSPALIAALVEQAAAVVGEIKPARVIPVRRAVVGLLLGIIPLGLLIVPALVLSESPLRTTLGRVFAPWANLGRVGGYELIVEPGHGRVALESRPTILATARPRSATTPHADDSWVEWCEVESTDSTSSIMGAQPKRLAMNAGPQAGQFSASLPRLKRPIVYRVVAGTNGAGRFDDEIGSRWPRLDLDASTSISPWYRLDTVEPPRIAGLSAAIEPPTYMALPPATASSLKGDGSAVIEAWQGSRIALSVVAGSGLGSASGTFEPDAGTAGSASSKPKLLAGVLRDDGRSADIAFPAEASGTLSLTLVDREGITAEAAALLRFVVRADAPPKVSVEEADREGDSPIEAKPDEVVRLDLLARDDFAVAAAELRVEVQRAPLDDEARRDMSASESASAALSNRANTARVLITIPGLGTRRAQGQASLSLEPFGLKAGDRVIYRARVTDNRPAPLGPNVGWSEPRTIVIARRSDTLAQRRKAAARAAVQARLDAAKRETARLRQESVQLRYAADAARQGNGGWDEDRQMALSGREVDSQHLVEDLFRLADLLATPSDPRGRPDPETDFHTLAPIAREAASREGETSRASLERARRARSNENRAEAAENRLEALRQADAQFGELASRLDDLQARFDATKPKGNSGQKDGKDGRGSSEGQTETAANRDGQSNNEESQNKKEGASGSQANGAAAASANTAKEKSRGQSEASRAPSKAKTGKPGASAPTGYPALHENAEPIPETGTGDIAALRDAMRKRSGRAWSELPGQLRSRILQMPQTHFRDEYSRQIERYYRELATGSQRSDD